MSKRISSRLFLVLTSFETFPELFLPIILTKLRWNFEFPIFNDYFFRKFQIYHCSLWRNKKTSIIWKTSDRRAKRSEICG